MAVVELEPEPDEPSAALEVWKRLAGDGPAYVRIQRLAPFCELVLSFYIRRLDAERRAVLRRHMIANLDRLTGPRELGGTWTPRDPGEVQKRLHGDLTGDTGTVVGPTQVPPTPTGDDGVCDGVIDLTIGAYTPTQPVALCRVCGIPVDQGTWRGPSRYADRYCSSAHRHVGYHRGAVDQGTRRSP